MTHEEQLEFIGNHAKEHTDMWIATQLERTESWVRSQRTKLGISKGVWSAGYVVPREKVIRLHNGMPDLTFKEMGDILGCSPATIQAVLDKYYIDKKHKR